MALSLSAGAILEKNKLTGSGAWLILIKVVFSESITIRVVRNNENITWDGYEWIAFPFDLDDAKEEGKGEHSVITLRISNVSRAIQAYMEAANGGVGASVDLYIVHESHLNETTAEVHETFICTSASANTMWANFELSSPNQANIIYPRRRYSKNFCTWGFKGLECGYSGATAGVCNRTLSDCRKFGNVRYFGATPGVPEGGIYAKTSG